MQREHVGVKRMHFQHPRIRAMSLLSGPSWSAHAKEPKMQIFSFVHAAVVAVTLAGVASAAALAYADAPKSASQNIVSQQTNNGGTAQQPPAVSNTGPYDSPDFVVPENDIP
jgi:hypothetical protein